jgi:Protein of unknown function (DUF2793)/Chaperone of endosialidase
MLRRISEMTPVTDTPRLAIPLLAAGQAQKHVTLNDALLRVDALVQLAVLDRDLNAPPASPASDARYIIGPSPTGAWVGRANAVAFWQDTDWEFQMPQPGWIAWVQDESLVAVFNGTTWGALNAVTATPMLGVNASADATNRLTVSAPATLLNHAGSGHQIKINKANATATASLLYQTGFSGRAEMGLAGSDAFTVKVSADGTTWQTPISIDAGTARITFSQGLTFQGITAGRGGGDIASNTAFGLSALGANSTGTSNIAVGSNALAANTTGLHNLAIGVSALAGNATGNFNLAVGSSALLQMVSGVSNTAIGRFGLAAATADRNSAIGFDALRYVTTGSNNTAIGCYAGAGLTTANASTALGYNALSSGNWANATGLGNGALVTGDNQVQLGNSATTTHVYGTVQSRSDARDKADIRDTALGLAFIRALRPRDFRWDMRDDYRKPGERIEATQPDGTCKRRRFHHGLIAQEVRQAERDTGLAFGGLQDHAVAGGEEVMTLGYEEFIGPLIRAVQELAERIEAAAPAHLERTGRIG